MNSTASTLRKLQQSRKDMEKKKYQIPFGIWKSIIVFFKKKDNLKMVKAKTHDSHTTSSLPLK